MTTGRRNIPGPPDLALNYDTRSWARGHAFEFDRCVMHTTYDLRRSAGTEADHWFRSEIRLVGSLMLARNSGGGGHMLVRSQQHIESNPGTYLKVQLFSKSGGTLVSGGGSLTLDPGSVFLIDQSRPYRQTMPAGQNLTFFLPHARVNYDPGILPAVVRLGKETVDGRYLSHSMRVLFRLLGSDPTAEAAGLAQALCGSIAGLLDWHTLRTERSTASAIQRIESARLVIDLNLADPEFGPEDVLAKVAASRATLYRDFAPMGGLMAYIQTRRLEMAYHILSISPRRHGAVSDVAVSAGFTSLAQFSRAFRNLYGCAPSDIFGQWRAESEDGRLHDGLLHTAQIDSLRVVYSWPSATAVLGRLPIQRVAQN